MEPPTATYTADVYSEPVILRVSGRASYLNAAPLAPFFDRLLKTGKRHIVIDFKECTGMDSTFLGLLAGLALELRKKPQEPWGLTLCRLNTRNLELVQNLGLDRLLTVLSDADFAAPQNLKALQSFDKHEIANAKLILKAHENLAAADAGNLKKFQDVINALRSEIG